MSNVVVGSAVNKREHKPSMIKEGRGMLYIGLRKYSSMDPSLAGLKFSDHKVQCCAVLVVVVVSVRVTMHFVVPTTTSGPCR